MNKETVLHSFLICVLLSSVLLLVGCTQHAADSGNVSPETDLPAQESSEPQSEDVLTAYDEAARLYDWFDLAPMPVDEFDSVREGETTYFRVRDDGITSTEDRAPGWRRRSPPSWQKKSSTRASTGTLTAGCTPSPAGGARISISWTKPCRRRG